MPSEGRGILSPVRLPVPPLQQVVGSLSLPDFVRIRRNFTLAALAPQYPQKSREDCATRVSQNVPAAVCKASPM